ncbi:hypothetical protein BN440_0696 [Erwinia amylovora MR1]|nr:hypothetical protein BN440_0696 [Erwinia amylovora MR1]
MACHSSSQDAARGNRPATLIIAIFIGEDEVDLSMR